MLSNLAKISGALLCLVFVGTIFIANDICPKSSCGEQGIVYVIPLLAFIFILPVGLFFLIAGLATSAKTASDFRILGYIVFALLIFISYFGYLISKNDQKWQDLKQSSDL